LSYLDTKRKGVFILVAREVVACTLPLAWWWAKAFVGEGWRVRPYTGVEHTDDDVSLQWKLFLGRLREAQEIP